MTDTVYTDSKGNFTLTWHSDKSISELYVNGKTVRSNAKSGDYVEIHLD